MYLDDNKIKDFLGTGSVNADGDNLSAFLEKYDASKYQNPCNTVDILIFTWREEENIKKITGILLIRRKNHPSIGWWALPGGFVDFRENLEVSALRELKEETGVSDVSVCQLKSYGDYDRDPRTRIITTAYVGLVRENEVNPKAGDDAEDAQWYEIKDEIIAVKDSEYEVSELHKLILTGKRCRNIISADIEVTQKKDTLLPDISYRVTGRNELASDHGAIILEGYHFVKENIK